MPYLGCVFTQHKRDEEGHPIRDHESTTYVSSFGSIDEFGPILRQEAIRRGLALAMQIVFLIDGAIGLANMGLDCFRGAIPIVDFYHAVEHAGRVLVALLGSKEHPEYKARLGRWAKQLLRDKVEKLIAQARKECEGTSRAEAVEKELAYFVNNVERMHMAPAAAKVSLSVRGGRGRVQDADRGPLQAVRHVLERSGSGKRSGVALCSHQPPT